LQPHVDGLIVFARLRQCPLPSNTYFLVPTRVHIPNCILIGSAVFAQFTAEGPYTLQWAATFAPQNCPPIAWGIWTTKCMVPWAHPSPYSKQHVDRLSHFSRLTIVIRHRPTDRPRYTTYVCNNRPHLYVRSTAMRPNNK